jgi:hypothetical protein
VVLTARTVNDLGVRAWRLGEDQRAAHHLMRSVPPLASVSTNERLVPHLADRPEVFIFPSAVGRARYVLERDTALTREGAPGYRERERRGPWVLLERE